MKRISVTFNTADGKIIVEFRRVSGIEFVDKEELQSPEQQEYTDRSSYLADWPDRSADCDAMGWV